MNMKLLLERLRALEAIRSADRVANDTLDRIRPQMAEAWPSSVHPAVRRALGDFGLRKPFQHQVAAVEASLSGRDVVMESPTASGKTLGFLVPMFDVLLRQPDSHGLLIYPTKALAFDQRSKIQDFCDQLGEGRRIESWPYDGDSDQDMRNAIRKRPPALLMTNPEYLNRSFLAYRDQWKPFLARLRFIVLDEVHEYRGFFGTGMALLLRRFLLQLNRLGASPRIFMATATCANPEEHATALTGRTMKLVQARDSLRPQREFIFVDPAIPDFRYRDIFRLRIELAALACLEAGAQVLIFCPSKRFLEEAFARTRKLAEEKSQDPNLFAPFHADLNPGIRRELQERIRTGEVRVIFATNALELGLDIGGLDGVILAGFPSNIMGAWQRIGRAGRSADHDAFVLFYAMNDPIDRFFASNLPAFLTKPYDELVVYPDNEEMIQRHLPSLREEASGSLRAAERSILGEAFHGAAERDRSLIPKGYKPQQGINLRGSFGRTFALKQGNRELGQISDERRFREVYLGAVFRFAGVRYEVTSHESDSVHLSDAQPNVRTDPSFFTTVRPTGVLDSTGLSDGTALFYGTLDIYTGFNGYRIVDEQSGEVKERVQASDGRSLRNLHGFWIQFASDGEDERQGIGGFEHLLRVGTSFVIPVDRFDTGTHAEAGSACIAYYFENYPGGIGVARKLWSEWQKALTEGIKIAENCRCSKGCLNCIEPPKSFISANIDKHAGIALARKALAATNGG